MSEPSVRIACFAFCAATRQDGKIDGVECECDSAAELYFAARIQYEKSLGENAIAESSFSGLPKCDCKRVGISRDMRYRNAPQPGTIYADLCGIRN
jgi:hypothetical protein